MGEQMNTLSLGSTQDSIVSGSTCTNPSGTQYKNGLRWLTQSNQAARTGTHPKILTKQKHATSEK